MTNYHFFSSVYRYKQEKVNNGNEGIFIIF